LQDDLDALAQSGAGATRLKRITSRHAGTNRIIRMNNTDGDTVSDIEGMCEVFAKFYEDLYSDCGSPATEPSRLGSATDDPQHVTPEELLVVMKSMKKNKTGAADGLVAEMLKTEHRGLLLAICDFLLTFLPSDWNPR
jgi:hypothetical protein